VNPITPEISEGPGNEGQIPPVIAEDPGNGAPVRPDIADNPGNEGQIPPVIAEDPGNGAPARPDIADNPGNEGQNPPDIADEPGKGGSTAADRQIPPHFAIAYFLLPFLFIGVYVWILYILLPYDEFLLIGGLMLAYLIPPAGKESVIPLGIALGLPWYLVATSVAMLDIATGLFMALNFDLAMRIPLLGPWVGRFMHHGQEFVRQRPWLERLYFVGLAVFVMVPLQGSGGIGASIVGRILGMSKAEVVAAIAIGAFAGSFLLALGFEFLKDILLANLSAGIAVIVAVIAGILIGYLYFSRKGRRNREKLR
jgi:uncharacterized membrane protein